MVGNRISGTMHIVSHQVYMSNCSANSLHIQKHVLVKFRWSINRQLIHISMFVPSKSSWSSSIKSNSQLSQEVDILSRIIPASSAIACSSYTVLSVLSVALSCLYVQWLVTVLKSMVLPININTVEGEEFQNGNNRLDKAFQVS